MTAAHTAFVAPTTTEKAFNCPHCGALAKQFWHKLHAEALEKDRIPPAFTEEEADKFSSDTEDKKIAETLRTWALRLAKKTPFLDNTSRDSYSNTVWNLWLSKCFNCNDVSVWLADRLVYPSASNVTPPNVDMPEEAKFDYREASSIVEDSPRGAAALLRLAIQKICKALGEKGENINDDIGSLVKKGLDSRVQQALDIVRVTGNNAVHPGEMDLKDDRDTAERLFSLVNLITEIMISQPKQISTLYNALPAGARAAVDRRDKK